MRREQKTKPRTRGGSMAGDACVDFRCAVRAADTEIGAVKEFLEPWVLSALLVTFPAPEKSPQRSVVLFTEVDTNLYIFTDNYV